LASRHRSQKAEKQVSRKGGLEPPGRGLKSGNCYSIHNGNFKETKHREMYMRRGVLIIRTGRFFLWIRMKIRTGRGDLIHKGRTGVRKLGGVLQAEKRRKEGDDLFKAKNTRGKAKVREPLIAARRDQTCWKPALP